MERDVRLLERNMEDINLPIRIHNIHLIFRSKLLASIKAYKTYLDKFSRCL